MEFGLWIQIAAVFGIEEHTGEFDCSLFAYLEVGKATGWWLDDLARQLGGVHGQYSSSSESALEKSSSHSSQWAASHAFRQLMQLYVATSGWVRDIGSVWPQASSRECIWA
jgi:hypothetical protein